MLITILDWIKNIKVTYNVNPWIFAIVYAVCVPPFWFSVFKLIDDLRNGRTNNILKWLFILVFTLIAPFLYIAFFGRNLPGWFWIAVAAFIALSVLSMIKKIRGKINA